MSRKGPFGLWVGMTVHDFGAPLDEIAPCKFQIPTVPKPHSAFERYVCQITPKLGLSWIKAVGKTIETSGYGVELKSAFESMEQKLATTYGKQTRLDFLMHESIWNEPRDWMQAVLSKERVLMSEWRKDAAATLSDSLTSVALIAGVYDTSSGYIMIEYSFENATKAEAEIAAMEDDAL
ncbi:MAG: hypothetical protein PHS32_08740 [Rhodoferax sp.]|uniref:hypothetical protein n=1 Tax=Rhodoferax sp. TaxID=50421 RepID=UPI00262A33BC|nr:hypothetical protein [Rhodoferax sp.]MDD5333821.1 hypothetical protein [Rhodoferax sp.]